MTCLFGNQHFGGMDMSRSEWHGNDLSKNFSSSTTSHLQSVEVGCCCGISACWLNKDIIQGPSLEELFDVIKGSRV